MIFTKLHSYKDLGILLLRLGIGLSFIVVHGSGKIFGGVERWRGIGNAMSNLGISFAPEFWGFMAAFAEFFGGILIILGLFFVPANILLAFTMFVAALRHIMDGDPLGRVAYPLEMLAVFIGLLFIGPGKYSLDYLFKRKKSKNKEIENS
jgi:putative oxidoreductase